MEDSNDNDIKEGVEQDISSDSKTAEQKENIESEIVSEEVKKLEEKEHYELDYFSKEDLVKEKENLEQKIKDLKEKTEKLQKENGESRNKFMHLQAEFENAQKRWDKNRQNLRIEYTASVLKNFLPLYDSFKKALESANETEKKIIEGFYNQFMNIFKSYGVEPIKVEINDEFDYSIHEALTSVEKEDVPENKVLEIVQDGFKYGKEVIRYTKVIISRKPKPPKPEPEEKEAEEEVSEEKTTEEEIPEYQEKQVKEKKHKKQKKEKDKESS
ncbi:MAG: nucleotide exchange factor GrpE [Candidatus Hodarchaeota archaeon]